MKKRMDLWADNVNFAAKVEIQVYEPLTDEDLGLLTLEVEGEEIVLRITKRGDFKIRLEGG